MPGVLTPTTSSGQGVWTLSLPETGDGLPPSGPWSGWSSTSLGVHAERGELALGSPRVPSMPRPLHPGAGGRAGHKRQIHPGPHTHQGSSARRPGGKQGFDGGRIVEGREQKLRRSVCGRSAAPLPGPGCWAASTRRGPALADLAHALERRRRLCPEQGPEPACETKGERGSASGRRPAKMPPSRSSAGRNGATKTEAALVAAGSLGSRRSAGGRCGRPGYSCGTWRDTVA